MLKVEHIKMKFKNQTIIKDATFIAKPKDIIHITGPNGCGKSTLFKILTGIYKPTSGNYKIDKEDQIGALIENPGFLEFEDLKTNLKFLANLKNHFNYAYTKELCDLLGLKIDNKLHMSKYSVGMRQKAGIVQAIMENQNLIFLDEPSRGLDQQALISFAKLINNLSKQNKTIIIASHDTISGINYTRHLVLKEGFLSEHDKDK